MEALTPSRTAQGAAMHRAAHQLLDSPPIFADPLALRIVGEDAANELRDGTARHAQPAAAGMRAFLATRSRFTEDNLAAAVERGIRQYVLLGAGLDTFAYRAADRFAALSVFEVDHPATQAWKRSRLAETRISIPASVTYAPTDFETETLTDGLARAGFDFARPAFFAWLGVVPYLTREAVMGTLSFVARATKPGGEIVFDYPMQGGLRTAEEKAAFDALKERVAALGEPIRSTFAPAEFARDLAALGFSQVDDYDAAILNARYFAGRSDGLKLSGAGHIMRARV